LTTLTTVEYGDFSPETTAGKLFTVVYVLVGVGLLLAFLTTVAAQVVTTHAHARELRRQHRVLGDDLIGVYAGRLLRARRVQRGTKRPRRRRRGRKDAAAPIEAGARRRAPARIPAVPRAWPRARPLHRGGRLPAEHRGGVRAQPQHRPGDAVPRRLRGRPARGALVSDRPEHPCSARDRAVRAARGRRLRADSTAPARAAPRRVA